MVQSVEFRRPGLNGREVLQSWRAEETGRKNRLPIRALKKKVKLAIENQES